MKLTYDKKSWHSLYKDICRQEKIRLRCVFEYSHYVASLNSNKDCVSLGGSMMKHPNRFFRLL